jgi:hypothetical protein
MNAKQISAPGESPEADKARLEPVSWTWGPNQRPQATCGGFTIVCAPEGARMARVGEIPVKGWMLAPYPGGGRNLLTIDYPWAKTRKMARMIAHRVRCAERSRKALTTEEDVRQYHRTRVCQAVGHREFVMFSCSRRVRMMRCGRCGQDWIEHRLRGEEWRAQ